MSKIPALSKQVLITTKHGDPVAVHGCIACFDLCIDRRRKTLDGNIQEEQHRVTEGTRVGETGQETVQSLAQ
ncbi:hypothetical protein KIN20_029006 [Parelaphostrongylus tenuis]|uniref:Uncharacterized protein n=1 Tax=Parelaphostrongylus tenuis TaxID=148309 RepID=A0AAD5R211_PARTN|nr:hypothetical protein KIN20_029006 [Parelaphostrongylus tenuis]